MKRGISSITAVIILVAIVAVGAFSTALLVLNTMRTLSESVLVAFDQTILLKSADKCVLKMTLKNVGTKPISAVKVIIGGEVYRPQISVLEPGRSMQLTIDLPAEKFSVGRFYTFSLEAEATDGSKFAYTTSLMCLWGDF